MIRKVNTETIFPTSEWLLCNYSFKFSPEYVSDALYHGISKEEIISLFLSEFREELELFIFFDKRRKAYTLKECL